MGADRVLAVLGELARHPDGVGLEEMARVMASPKPTVHRALAALRRAGFAGQDGYGRYVLGDEFLRLAFAHHEARPDHVRVQPVLRRLCERYGETAHYATLDGRSVVYRSKLDPPSRRGAAHLGRSAGATPRTPRRSASCCCPACCTTEREVRDWIGDRPLTTPTERVRSTPPRSCTPSWSGCASAVSAPTTRRTSPA